MESDLGTQPPLRRSFAISLKLEAVTFCHKQLYLRCNLGYWIHLCIIHYDIYISAQNNRLML